jgi:hypothetical protein
MMLLLMAAAACMLDEPVLNLVCMGMHEPACMNRPACMLMQQLQQLLLRACVRARLPA